MDERAERPEELDEPERGEDELASLTRILVDPERRQLAALQSRLNDLGVRARDIGEVLPQVLHRQDRKSTRLNSSHQSVSRMPSSA